LCSKRQQEEGEEREGEFYTVGGILHQATASSVLVSSLTAKINLKIESIKYNERSMIIIMMNYILFKIGLRSSLLLLYIKIHQK
jgi:hypothetical protein